MFLLHSLRIFLHLNFLTFEHLNASWRWVYLRKKLLILQWYQFKQFTNYLLRHCASTCDDCNEQRWLITASCTSIILHKLLLAHVQMSARSWTKPHRNPTWWLLVTPLPHIWVRHKWNWWGKNEVCHPFAAEPSKFWLQNYVTAFAQFNKWLKGGDHLKPMGICQTRGYTLEKWFPDH